MMAAVWMHGDTLYVFGNQNFSNELSVEDRYRNGEVEVYDNGQPMLRPKSTAAMETM